jgi:hypothetical protein
MKITIETIDHNDQRYNTVGDWQFDDEGNLNIKVSNTASESYNFLIGVHELVEAYLCKIRGISTQDVDKFDIDFISRHSPLWEPGDSKDAPYHIQHKIATVIEYILLKELRLTSEAYESHIQYIIELNESTK